MKLSDPLTRATSAACRSTVMKRWMTPIPPMRAMAIAIADSVTVSMLAVIKGSPRESLPDRSVTETSTSWRES